jgi:type IV secretory pathway VirB6-like protein
MTFLVRSERSTVRYLFEPLLVVLRAQTMTQGISSEIVFYDGFRRQIHPSIITLPPRLITMVQPNGFFKAIYLINGNLRVHSCGYMESVCHS